MPWKLTRSIYNTSRCFLSDRRTKLKSAAGHYPKFLITQEPDFIQHSFGRFGHSNQSRKRNKRNPNWKRISKTLTICRWHDPLHIKPWIFIARTHAEAKVPNTLVTWWDKPTHWKILWCWQRLMAKGEGDYRGWDGWMASPTQWTWVWACPEDSEGQGSLACCSSRSRKEWDKI